MLPLRDDNPTFATPVVTLALIGACAGVWLFVQGLGAPAAVAGSVCRLGLIPGELLRTVPPGTTMPLSPDLACTITDTPDWRTPVTSMFLHGGWLHLLGNLWFLWVFGNNVEDAMGRGRFLVFYVLCGLAAAAAQVASDPASPVPMVGASGAIGGVMGAYVVLYPRVRVHLLVFLGFFVTTFAVPAYLMLGYWLLLQVLQGMLTPADAVGGVAVWAHAGGFVAGVLLVSLFRDRELVERHRRLVLAAHGGRWA